MLVYINSYNSHNNPNKGRHYYLHSIYVETEEKKLA